MKLKLLLSKSLLVVALLGVGCMSAWAGVSNVFSQASWTHTHPGAGQYGDRSSSLSFDGTSSIADNWTTSFDVITSSTNSRTNGARNFQVALLSASAASFPSNALATTNVLLGARFQTVNNTDYSSFACTITVNDVDEAGTVTLNHGTKYTFNVSVNGTSMTVSIKNGSTSVFSKNATLEAFVKPKGIYDLLPRPYNASWGVYTNTYNNILVTKEVDEETVSNPSISNPSYAVANRTITISSGVSSEANSVTTYYTIDGTDPSSSNYAEFFTTESKEVTITSNCTVKAISVSSTDVESSIVSRDITAGKLTLNAPTITITNLVANGGVYNATYSFASDQSDILGSPTATLSYTFAGGSSTEGTSYTPTTAGQLIVTASADNYTSKSTTIDITLPNFVRTYFADFSTLEKGDKSGYTSYQINSVGCDFYSFTNTFDELTLSGLNLAWAITNAYVVGLHARGSAGTVTYKESFVDGAIIDFSCAGTASTYHIYSTKTTTTIPQYSGVYNMSIYSPVVTASIGEYGYATFCSAYPLDFTNVDNATAWVATNVGDGKVTLTQVEGDIYQGKGLILKSNSGVAAEVTIPVVASSTNYYDDKKLVACLAETTVNKANDGTCYVLSVQGTAPDETVVFAPIGDTSATVNAGQCYMWDSGTGARSLSFVFGEETTGISDATRLMNNDESIKNGEVYNLSGQRVAQPSQGIYIIDGKKVIIK